MPVEIHPRFFAMFGLLLGALYGFIFSVWKPPRTVIITDLYNPLMWTIAILSFFVLQYGLGVLLNKPSTSRELYFGVLLIPLTYTAPILPVSILSFLQTVAAVEIPALVLFIASFYIISPFVSLFAGFDTKVLDEAKISVETAFSFDIQYSTIEEEQGLRLLKRIVHGMGLTIRTRDVKDNNGLIICRKEKLHMGIVYESRDQILTVTFFPFRIVNDVVRKVENLDAILDFKAQISGMLYAWMQNNLILRFTEALPNFEIGLKTVSEGLGPLKTPLLPHIRETIISFPKNHPYQLALLTTGSVIIINVMLFVLGKLVFT